MKRYKSKLNESKQFKKVSDILKEIEIPLNFSFEINGTKDIEDNKKEFENNKKVIEPIMLKIKSFGKIDIDKAGQFYLPDDYNNPAKKPVLTYRLKGKVQGDKLVELMDYVQNKTNGFV